MRISFQQFVVVITGRRGGSSIILDSKAASYVKRLPFHISLKQMAEKSKSNNLLGSRIQICILRSVSNCFRGSRTKWRGGNVEDGVGMPRMED